MHVQDITNQTLDMLKEYALLQGSAGIIRLDDVTFDSQVEATKKVADLAIDYNETQTSHFQSGKKDGKSAKNPKRSATHKLPQSYGA